MAVLYKKDIDNEKKCLYGIYMLNQWQRYDDEQRPSKP